MTRSVYLETIDFLEELVEALKDDGRYEEYFNDKKHISKLYALRSTSNKIFELMPDF